ncbi:MAG TPA: CPBP family intramembrane glutamic endopeptidase, partial [Anaerolineaceae bacterium]|nr:CPBP family intramembrane glutamic endopeptidase [Anaerolineaceae bacterium]
HSILNAVRGNWKVYLQWVVMVWLLVAILEEGIFRGYFITELTSLFGKGILAVSVGILISSLVFGLSHGYQNKCGILSTGIVGIILGIIFVLSEYNLWLVIFTHGFVDTVGIGLIAVGLEDKLKIHF